MKLIADNLSIARGGRLVVENVTFVAESKQALIVTGPNGAGKTTLLRAIVGFVPVLTGTLALQDNDQDRSIGESCHYVAHRDAIKSDLTVLENVRFWARYLAEDATGNDLERARFAIEKLGLGPLTDIQAGYLSAGQRRRLGLARLLVASRPVWLLDEPTVSLDAASVQTLAVLIQGHLDNGGIAIAATHVPLGLNDTRELRLELGATGRQAA